MMTSLPNLLTYLRIIVIPILVVCFFSEDYVISWLAISLYTAACITDYFDGWLARHLNQVSALGRFLDPIADKLLVATVVLMLVSVRAISGVTVVAAVIILCRELLVSGLREFLAGAAVSMPVIRLAKWKTTVQMAAIGFLMVNPSSFVFIYTRPLGICLLWLAALLTLVTGYNYLYYGIKHIVRL